MRQVKASTARTIMVLMVSSTDHITGVAGATLTVTISKAGAAFGSISPTITDRGSGWYSVALVAGNLDTLGDLALHATASGCDPSDALLEVVAYDPGDAAGLGLSRLDATVSSRSTYSGADTSGTTTLLGRVLGTVAAGTHQPQSGDAFSRIGANGAGLTNLATDATAQAIKTKTDNLPDDPADQSLLIAAIAGRAAPGDAMTLTAGAIDDILDDTVEGTMTLRQAIRILMSVAAGETVINDLGGGAAQVTFKSQDGTIDRVFAIMAGSERTSVTVNGG